MVAHFWKKDEVQYFGVVEAEAALASLPASPAARASPAVVVVVMMMDLLIFIISPCCFLYHIRLCDQRPAGLYQVMSD
jgi:hypothetical protein